MSLEFTPRLVPTLSLLVLGMALGVAATTSGCAAATEGDEAQELSDEGPLGDDVSSDAVESVQIGEVSEALTTTASFQLPFPCGQVWAGQTRTNHSPQNSVDFNRSGDESDTVVAAASGTVTRVENLGSQSYGRWIEVSHGNGYTTRYAHLSSQSVSRGQRVSRGQKLGAVGNTGGSSGAHLHYEQRRNGVAVRPSFDGAGALFFGTRSYTSKNCTASVTPNTGSNAGSSARIETSGAPLNVRAGAGTGFAVTGTVNDGQAVTITCQTRGTQVSGPFGRTDLWDKIGSGYFSDAYVFTGTDGRVAPDCR